MNICMFLVSGKTFSFKNVVIEYDNESVIQFTYKAMSDGKVKKATFYKQNVAGMSTFK